MANSINWGEIYCTTNFGDTPDSTDEWFRSYHTIPSYSAPTCWAEDVLRFSVDSTTIEADTTLYTADATQF